MLRYILISLFITTLAICALFVFRVEFAELYFTIKGLDKAIIERRTLLVYDYPGTYLKHRIETEVDHYFYRNKKLELKNAIALRQDLDLSNYVVELNHREFHRRYKSAPLSVADNQDFLTSYASDQVTYNSPILQWTLELDSKATIEAQPKLCGQLLISTTHNEVLAINYRTGEIVWRNRISGEAGLARRSVTCQQLPTANKLIIFVPSSHGIYCLDAETGQIAKNICKKGRLGNLMSRIPPQVHENRIFIATMNPSGLEAYDIVNGDRLWRTDFEKGQSLLRGGSNPWSGLTIDHHRGLLFVNTGSPSAWPRFIYGPDKYHLSNSLLAINADNGSIKWQFSGQSVDFWDHDFVGHPVLVDDLEGGIDAVITFSKGGSVFFLDRETGESLYPIAENRYSFGNLSYSVKSMTTAKPLIEFPAKIQKCTTCGPHTLFYGMIPPVMKKERIFDGVSGGPQWPGAGYDESLRLLLIPSNRNMFYQQFYDFEVKKEISLLSKIKSVNQCFLCHNKHGKVGVKDGRYIPSLLFVSKLYDVPSLLTFLENSPAHHTLAVDLPVVSELFELFKQYDVDNFKSGNFQVFSSSNHLNPLSETVSGLAPFGLITAISIDTGKLIWQIPAGEFTNEMGRTLLGSPNFGGIAVESSDTSYSYFTGSYDKKIYSINNLTGQVVWDYRLKASGTAPPLVVSQEKEHWIFVIATGGRVAGDNGASLYGFMRTVKPKHQ